MALIDNFPDVSAGQVHGPSRDQLHSATLSIIRSTVPQMSEKQRKTVHTVRDLEEEFRELQQLRKTVRELQPAEQSKDVPPKRADRTNDAK